MHTDDSMRCARPRLPGEGGCNQLASTNMVTIRLLPFLAIPAQAGPMLPQAPELIAFCDRVPSDSSTPAALWVPACPTDLGPWAEGPRDGVICSEGAMKASRVTASFAGKRSGGGFIKGGSAARPVANSQ